VVGRAVTVTPSAPALPANDRGPPDAADARLVIRLLGEVLVAVDGRSVPELATPRMQRLWVRLVIAPERRLLRSQLAAELWPESSDGQARTNLRKLLHDLRRLLPEEPALVDVDSRTVQWRARSLVWVDVLAFTDAVARGLPGEAIESYGGDLLPNCDDVWVEAERERLRRLAVETLVTLAEEAAAEHRDSAVLGHTHHLLRIDALHEPACRLLMRALARRGERSEALRTYDRLAARLAGELGVEPEPATTVLAEQLRHPAWVDRTGPALVGRSREWRAATRAWREAVDGRARLLCVQGEAGIGKSRLVEELARRVATHGHPVVYGRAYEAAGRPPWGPVIDWLRSTPVRSCLDGLDDVWLAELARLLPELRTAHPEIRHVPTDADVGGRRHLLDAVCRALLAPARPLLLVLDDLQWCDAETIELCGFLVQSAPAAPVLIAGTVRDEEVAATDPLARLRPHLARAGALSVIALDRLDRTATMEIALHVGGRRLGPEAAAQLWAETEGNPLFIVEAVRAGYGSASRKLITLTPTVQAVITARLDRLSPGARSLVEAAATIGREFTAPVLAAAAGRSEDDLTDDLDELWQHNIVRARGSVFDFSHDRLRDVALASISPARRRRLHRCVAEAIEARHADELGPVSARLAVHLEGAGMTALALDAYERAARHAYRVFALDACIALLREALRLLDASAPGSSRDAVELRLLSAIGVPLVARFGYGAPDVQRCYTRALTLHRRLGSSPSPSVLRGLALHAVAVCRFRRAEDLGRELIVGGRRERTARVEGEYVLGVADFWLGNLAAAERHLSAAIEAYHIEDAPLHVARYAQDPLGVCLSRLALTQLFRGRPDEADRTIGEALRVATELGNPMTVCYVRAFDAVLAALEPERRDLDSAVVALGTITSTMHLDYFATVARLLAGWRDIRAGDPAGVAVLRQATDWLRREQPLHLTLGLSLLARAYRRMGDAASGRAVVADALDMTDRSGQRYLLAELLRVDAELLALSWDEEGAVDRVRQAVATAVAMGSPWLRDRAIATLSRISRRR